MKKIAVYIMLITIFSKVFGFGREIVLAYYFGASNISDAYLIAMTIPVTIFGFIGSGISTGFIPIYSNLEAKCSSEKANLFTNNLINILMILSTFIISICLINMENIVKLFASGFDYETMQLAVRFTNISIIGIYFSMLIYIFNGYLQVKGRYLVTTLVAFPLNIITIISILLGSRFNINILAYGGVVAIVTQLIFLSPYLYKEKYKYKPVLNFKDPSLLAMLSIALPVILGVSVNQINIIVDRTIASSIAIGGVSALNYANRINLFVQGVFVISITKVIYPLISKMAANNKMKELKIILKEGINLIVLLVIPSTLGFLVFAKPIVELLFGRGAFQDSAIEMTSNALFFYSIGMIGYALRDILLRAFYSLQDSKIPMRNAIIGMLLNIILNIVLSRYLGIGGLALATSISAIFTTFLLFISLRKKIGPFGMKQISISFLKILFASLVMGLLAKLSFNYLTASLSQNISLLIAIGVGAVSYFVIIYFMKIEDVDVIVGAIKKKLGRGAA